MDFEKKQFLIKEYENTLDRVLKRHLSIKELKQQLNDLRQQLNEEIDNYQRDKEFLIGLYSFINKSDSDKRESFTTGLDLIFEDIANS